MTTKKIKQILLTENVFKKLVSHKNTISLLCIGSVATGKYIDGWSDIDLLVLTNNSDSDYLRLLSRYRSRLAQKTKVKTGIEIINYRIFEGSFIDKVSATTALKLAKVFCKEDSPKTKEILFLRENYKLPEIGLSQILRISPASHAIDTVSYIQKLLLDFYSNDSISNKSMLRKIIKNSLFLIQMYVLSQKSILISNFDQAIREYTSVSDVNISTLVDSFGKRFYWSKLNDEDISYQEIQENWRALINIANNTIKLC
jgi:predicted nucleotidyltransferase